MSYNVDFTIASSKRIEEALCKRLEQIRLTRNITQAQLAAAAGISVRTIRRLEKGEGISLDTFIRVLKALGVKQNLEELLPDPTIRPVDLVKGKKEIRKRARPKHNPENKKGWIWGDEKVNDDK
jgi:putative transcriptional regulator